MSNPTRVFPSFPFPCVFITDSFKGMLAPQQLLKKQGAVQMMLQDPSTIPTTENGYIFVLQDEGFAFCFYQYNGSFILRRNSSLVKLDWLPIKKSTNPYALIPSWTKTKLIISLIPYKHEALIHYAESKSAPTTPPPSLLNWSRRQNLKEKYEYESETEFYTRVFAILGGLQEKINLMTNVNVFWNIEYDRNKIISRKPKRETDLHPAIHSILADHAFISSIEVVPEYRLGSGALDFMFLGAIRSQGIAKVCVEFKNLHSPDMVKGLCNQLPEYMRRAKASHGAYCTLDFRGPWFAEPEIESMSLSALVTEAIHTHSKGAHEFPIQYFQYRVGKSDNPST